jgi:hypothetical protein
MRGAAFRFRLVAVGVLASGLILGLGGSSAGAKPPRPGDRTERVVHSTAPDADVVKESYVHLYKPLPPAAGDHPARCDWIGYLRFRHAGGPRDPSHADAVFVSMPGIFAGSSMHDQVARNVVRRAAKGGEDVEYWALDRRSNCLEDHRGTEAAAERKDPSVAFDYYWGDRKIHGHSFGGFKTPSEASFLSHVGLAKTVRDERYVIAEGIPNRHVQRRKVFCGGHSLGGPLTTAFAGWDFDHDPSTRRDAGFKMCTGFFGQDTSLGFDSSGGHDDVGVAVAIAQASGASPYLNAVPFTPETIQILGPFGVGAYFDPHGTNVIGMLPHTPNIDLAQRVLFSRDAVNFVTDNPDIRDFNLTNDAVMAGVFDDNSSPITILRTSVGDTAGGPVVQKNFPTNAEFSAATGITAPLADNKFLGIPETPHGPLYKWRNYNHMPGSPPRFDDTNQAYTSKASEVADVSALAREQFEAPADFAEQYFPTRLTTDLESAQSGDRSGNLKNLRYNGIAKHPAFLIDAGDSSENSGATPVKPPAPDPPNAMKLSGGVVLPGYNHIDIVGAAWRQNGGKPERSSKTLVDFAHRVRRPAR